MGGAEEDLLEGPVLHGRHASAPWKRRVEGRHAPVETAAWRLLGARQRRADHHGVRARGDSFRDVPACAHAAVGDDVAVLTGLEHVLGPRGRDVGDCGGLGNPDSKNPARRARGAGTDADEDANRPGTHEVQSGGVGRTAADDARHGHFADEPLEVERLGLRRDVLRRDHRSLDHEDVEPGLQGDLVVLGYALRSERSRRHDAMCLDLLNPLRDQLRLDRLGVDLLHHLGGHRRVGSGDAL